MISTTITTTNSIFTSEATANDKVLGYVLQRRRQGYFSANYKAGEGPACKLIFCSSISVVG